MKLCQALGFQFYKLKESGKQGPEHDGESDN